MRLIKRNIQKLKIFFISFLLLFSQLALPITALSTTAHASAGDINISDHEGELAPVSSWTNGHIKFYRELESINFRFDVDSAVNGSKGTIDIKYAGDDSKCMFFDGSFNLGTHDSSSPAVVNTGGVSPVVTKVGAPVGGVGVTNWTQTVDVDFINGSGSAEIYYYLTLTDEAGDCTGASTHTQFGAESGDVGNTGAQAVPIPAKDIIEIENGSITIEKQTLPDASNQAFEFTGDVAGSLSDGQSETVIVEPNTYTSTETPQDGWDLTNITCSDDDSTGNIDTGVATFIVAAGEDVKCVFTNTKRSHIIVKKNAIPDSSQEFTFENDFGNSNPSNFSLVDDSTPGLPQYDAEVLPGTYSVKEDNATGWKSPAVTKCSNDDKSDAVAVLPGETVTCTFTNKQHAQITLTKKTVGGDAKFDFTMTGKGLPASTSLTTFNNEKSEVFTGLNPDRTFTIAEDAITGWDLKSATCDNGDPVSNITPNAGEEIECTFENIQRGTIVVAKQTIPDGSTQDFVFAGDVSGTIKDGEIIVEKNVKPGQYTSTEALLDGWDLTGIVCNDGNSTGNIDERTATFNVEAGERVRCTFTNDRQPVTVVAHKIVCTDEAELPNWGLGGSDITGSTAEDWVKANDSCEFGEGWEFQWSFNGVGNPGDNEEYGGSGWTTFEPTDSSGETSVEIDSLKTKLLWFREVLKDGYLPFTYSTDGNKNDVTAEFYCNNDVLNYDNWDWIKNPEYGTSYNCVAWNVELGYITAIKYNDLNGNQKPDYPAEPRLDDWAMTLYNEKGDEITTGVTGDDGEGRVEFHELLAGKYTVCETMKDGWINSEPGVELGKEVCRDVNVKAGEKSVARFGNRQFGDVKVTKFHDLNENGYFDKGEEALPDWEINMRELDDSKPTHTLTPVLTGTTTTQTTGEDGTTTFKDLTAWPQSIYELSENEKDGWHQTGIYCTDFFVNGVIVNEGIFRSQEQKIYNGSPMHDSRLVFVHPGEVVECFVGNTYDPVLEIAKSNDSIEPEVVGNSVTYTITVTVPEESGCVYREGMMHYYPGAASAQFVDLPYFMFGRGCDTQEEEIPNDLTRVLPTTSGFNCVDECEEEEFGEVMVTDLPPVGFEYAPGSWEAYSNVRGDLKSAGITTEPTYASPGQWNLTNSDSPFLVPGEVVTLTYVALIDSAVTDGDYPDTAFVEGYTNSGGEKIYGNLHFTGDDPFVGTQVTVVSVDVTEQGYVLGTLQTTGTPAILAPIIGALLAVGAVLTVTNRKKRRLFKNFGKSLASLGLGLMISVFMFNSAFAAGYWTTNISTPEAYTTNGVVNIDYQVTSTDAADTFDVSLLQDGSSILMQSVTTPYGDSGRFPLTLTTEGTYVFKTSTLNNNGGDTKVSDEVTVTFDKTAPSAPTYNGVTRSGDTYTVSFTAPTGNVSTVNVYTSTATQFDLNASTLVGVVAVTPGETAQYVYTAPDSAQRHFAITAEDAAGNQSPAVGDQETVTTVVPADGSTDSSTSASGSDDGTVSDDAATTDAGVEGTSDESSDESSDTGTIVAMSGIILFAVLAGAAYFVINNNRKPQE